MVNSSSALVASLACALVMSNVGHASEMRAIKKFPYGTVISGSLALDGVGRLYGITQGTSCGTVFRLTPAATPTAQWQETELLSFYSASVGCYPTTGVVRNATGGLVTATRVFDTSTYSAIVDLSKSTTSGSQWVGKIMADFKNERFGKDVWGPLVVDVKGAVYGTVYAGGTFGNGSVFKLTPASPGSTKWTKSILYNFRGGTGGTSPSALFLGDSGALYGTTDAGGTAAAGIVFRLTPAASTTAAWKYEVLHNFEGWQRGLGGGSRLVQDKAGTLYGTTYKGGATTCPEGCGLVFALSPPTAPSTKWNFKIIYKFKGGLDGYHPSYGVVRDQKGTLYGVTIYGGLNDHGVVYKLVPPTIGKTNWTRSVLYRFGGGAVTGRPSTPLILGSGGALHGGTKQVLSTDTAAAYKLVP
jgi:uncharacterized repeat protein (TIGR03803 family)